MEKLLLKNQLCFKFYALSRHITSLYRPLLAELGFTYPQYLAMLVLWEHGQISVKDLGEQLLLDSGTLTPLLKRLEQKGLIYRKRSEEDERIVQISLTSQGQDIKQKASCVPDQLIKSIALSVDELTKLESSLNKMMYQLPN